MFMDLSLSFKENFEKKKVCWQKKSLYNLKQSLRALLDIFWKVVKLQGYAQSQADYTTFYKHSTDEKVAMLIVYMDDIILIEDDVFELDKLKEVLVHEFETKDLDPLKCFLRMEFTRTKKCILYLKKSMYLICWRK